MDKIYYCSVSGEPLPGSRVDALKMLGVPESQWTSISNSKVRKFKGIYFGEQGSGKLIIADRVYSESLSNIDDALQAEEKRDKTLAS